MATRKSSNVKSRAKTIALGGKDSSKVKFQREQLESKKETERLESENAELKQKTEQLRDENEKLKRKLDNKSGTSLDSLDRMKSELDRLRSTNRFLIEDIERRKLQVSDAQTLAFELQMRMESTSRENEICKRENMKMQSKLQSLQTKQNKFKKLTEENNKLKGFLFNHKIDSKTGKFVGIKINKTRNEPLSSEDNNKDASDPVQENSASMTTTTPRSYIQGRYVDIHRNKLTK